MSRLPLEPNPLARTHARVALAAFVATALFLVAVTFSPLKSGFADAPDRGPGDVQLYRAEVDRIRTGQSYYDAASHELAARGYPTASVFNWRMPLPVWIVGQFDDITASKFILGGLCFLLVCMSFHLLANEGSVRQGTFCALLLVGAIMPCLLGDLVVMSELWSGVFIALSVCCLGAGFSIAGVASGVAALFFRELAAPYVLVCLVLAARSRSYRELGLWAAGLAAYGVFFAFHVVQVLPRASGGDIAQVHGWIRFGGAGFLISAAQMNAFLLLLPQWVTAVYLAAVLAGCAAWSTPAGQRIGLTIALYAIAFSAVGNDFNQYWGSMTAPLYCLAACRAPAALRYWWNAGEFRAANDSRHLTATG